MASKHPRLGVTRDSELDQALTQTKRLLDERETRSAAAHVRALALRGAESLVNAGDDPAARYRRRFREKYNVSQPATADPRSLPMPEGDIDPDDPTPMSDALRWARGKE